MMKSAAKLIAFVAAYTAVAYLVLVILGAMTGSDSEAGPTLLAALLVAMVTVLFDDKGTVPPPARTAVLVLLVPVVAAWAYLGYRALNADFPESGYIWQPLLCIALFVTPTLIGRRLRRGWKRRL
jgi:hypothetical protein